MDWNTIITVATVWLLAAIIGRLWVLYIGPWLEQHHLTEAAAVAVQAAEALFGRYHGEEKLRHALEQLSAAGFDTNSQIVLEAVKAAWERLNIDMITAGIKDAANYVEDTAAAQDVQSE